MKSAFPVFSCILGAATTLHALALPQVDQGATGTGVTVETAEDLGAWPPLYKRAYLIQDDLPVRLSINDIWALQPEIRGRQDEVIDFVSDFRHYIDEFYLDKGQTLWGTVGIKLLDPESVTYWDLKIVDTAKDKSQLTPGVSVSSPSLFPVSALGRRNGSHDRCYFITEMMLILLEACYQGFGSDRDAVQAVWSTVV